MISETPNKEWLWLPWAALSERVRSLLRPAGLVAALGIAGAVAFGGLALRGHIVEAARRDLDTQAALAADAVAFRLSAWTASGGLPADMTDALPHVDLSPGGALALFGEDGALLGRLPRLPSSAAQAGHSLPLRDHAGMAGLVVVPGMNALPPRLLAWRQIPEHGVVITVSRETAVVLLPWTRGMQAVLSALLAILAVAGAYDVAARRASARARAAAAALSVSEARAGLVADALDVAVWTRTGPDTVTRFFGDSVQRLTGHRRTFLESRPNVWLDAVVHPDDRAALRDAYAKAAAEARGDRASDETHSFRICRADGEERWILSRARRCIDGSAVGVLHDVTELTLAEAALARREEDMAEVLRIARIGTWRMPLEHDRLDVSAELAAQWSLPATARSLPVEMFAAMLSRQDRAAVFAALDAVRRSAEPAEFTFGLRLPDGAHRHAWARARLERGPHGTPGAIIAVCQDITERHAAEHAVAHAQRMSALGHLTGGVAHDFNNLLTVVLLNLERIADAAPAGSGTSAAVEPAIRAAETAARLTAQLLAFAGRQRLRPVMLDPAALIEDLAPLLARAVGPGISLRSSVAPGTPRVRADPTQLRTALLNLAVNARDAMDGQGVLEIAIGHAGDRLVSFAVADHGCGMTPEVAARAFEPFFTTKPAGHGSGLGLSQAYGFVAQSKGEITLTTAPGQGTTVRFLLPAVMTKAAVA